jgi:hypothetical protein
LYYPNYMTAAPQHCKTAIVNSRMVENMFLRGEERPFSGVSALTAALQHRMTAALELLSSLDLF